jgi:4-amino-4-deoxy-L-arabinose transferase-like glycosyltransferase
MIQILAKRENMQLIKERPYLIPFACLILVTVWLRIANLGYSDYQGDEIKALATPLSGQGMADFLLEQRKGPVQFLITYGIKLAHPSLSNQFITRLPFALAGILGVYFFYRLAGLLYGRVIGLIAGFFLSLNGLFIGLSRIVQYQAIVILFSILTLYAFSLATHSPRWRIAGLYTGFICWAIAILAHYDGIFIAPFAIYLLARWYAGEAQLSTGRRLAHIGLPALLFVLILLAFFVPFLSSLGESTLDYWFTRISGDEIQAGIPSSMFTFQLYNPLLAIYLYAILVGLSLL